MTFHHFHDSDSRAPVVLLHASASNHKQWTSLIDVLGERHEVVALNLPGYAEDAPKRLGEVEGLAATAIPMIAEILKLSEPVHLVGHSFGGGVALKIALMRPDLVKSLTLYEPAAFSMLQGSDHSDRACLNSLRAIGRALTIASRIGQPMSGMKGFVDFWNGAGAWKRMPHHVQDKMCRMAKAVSGDFDNGFAERWSLEDLGELTVPTSLMMGLESPDVAQRTTVVLSEIIPGADLAILPCLGHMAPITDPDWVSPRVSDHIARVEQDTQPCVWPQRTAA